MVESVEGTRSIDAYKDVENKNHKSDMEANAHSLAEGCGPEQVRQVSRSVDSASQRKSSSLAPCNSETQARELYETQSGGGWVPNSHHKVRFSPTAVTWDGVEVPAAAAPMKHQGGDVFEKAHAMFLAADYRPDRRLQEQPPEYPVSGMNTERSTSTPGMQTGNIMFYVCRDDVLI